MKSLLIQLIAKKQDTHNKEKFYEGAFTNYPKFSFYVSKTGKTGEIKLGGLNRKRLAKGARMTYFPSYNTSNSMGHS